MRSVWSSIFGLSVVSEAGFICISHERVCLHVFWNSGVVGVKFGFMMASKYVVVENVLSEFSAPICVKSHISDVFFGT